MITIFICTIRSNVWYRITCHCTVQNTGWIYYSGICFFVVGSDVNGKIIFCLSDSFHDM